jgi:hypothetical protein
MGAKKPLHEICAVACHGRLVRCAKNPLEGSHTCCPPVRSNCGNVENWLRRDGFQFDIEILCHILSFKNVKFTQQATILLVAKLSFKGLLWAVKKLAIPYRIASFLSIKGYLET